MRARRRARRSCSPSTASPRSAAPCTSTARCARRGCSRVRDGARPRACSTPARREAFAVADHQIAHVYVQTAGAHRRGAARCSSALDGVERVLDEDGQARARPRPPALGRAGRDLRAPIAGSPTTTGSTTTARPTTRAPSTSTASPATTRSSCSSIRQLALAAAARSAATLRAEDARLPLPDGRHPARRVARQRLARPAHRRPEEGPLFITSEPGLAAASGGRDDVKSSCSPTSLRNEPVSGGKLPLVVKFL